MHDRSKLHTLTAFFHALAVVACTILLTPWIRFHFFMAGLRWAYILLISCLLSFSLTPLFCRIAKRLKITDRPGGRKDHSIETPLLGGAAVFIAFSASILANGIFSFKLWAILNSSVLIFAAGIRDDIKNISALIKLSLQIVCTIIVMASGVTLRVIPESLGYFAMSANYVLTLLWIVGITNAMNFFDGMNGLASGLGAIIAFFLGMAAFQTNQHFLGWISVAMMGSCLGFLPFNFRKKGEALIFLGDAGSTTIGFILACLAVYGEWSMDSPLVALTSPILIFWILIFDMIHITVDRILSGKVGSFREWVEFVGKDHLHHRLANVLGSTRKSVIFIFFMNFCLGASAIALRNARVIDAILLLIQAVIIVVLITILERRGRRMPIEMGTSEVLDHANLVK